MATATDRPTDAPPFPPDTLYEVVGEQVVETPPMSAYEYWLANVLADLLTLAVRERQLGRILVEMLFDLRPAVDRDRRPDVAFVSAERWPPDRPAPRTNAWAVIPDLAVEIVSASNTATEVLGKIEEYFTAGVRRVWAVYPDQRKVYDYDAPTAVRVLTPADVLDGGVILPGFRLPLADLFAEADGAGA